KNQKGYTAEQVSSIKSRIKGAAKKLGIEISDDSDSKAAGVDYIDVVRTSDGGQALVAVMTDGSRVPLPKAPAQARTLAAGSVPMAAVPRVDRAAPSPVEPTPPFNPNAGPIDPHDQGYDKSDLGDLDPGELHGGPAPSPSPQAGSGFRSTDDDEEVTR